MDKEDEIKYVVNNTFITYEINKTVFPRGKFVPVEVKDLEKLKKDGVFSSLLNNKDFTIVDEIDDSMRTTEEKLQLAKEEAVAKAKEATAKAKEAEELKKEALEEIAKRDAKIAELEAKLKAKGSK